MSILEGLKLGTIQGLTEFLPVSSSGHLVLFSSTTMTTFTELLFHAATLLAVVIVFRKEATAIFLSPLKLPRLVREGGWKSFFADPDVRLLLLLAAATIPAAVAGFLSNDAMEKLLHHPHIKKIVAASLTVTGLVLLSTRIFRKNSKEETALRDISLKQVLLIGCIQALAIMPGLSRSGLTITAGLLLGLARPAAGTFSFLLSIPIITGASLYQILKTVKSGAAAFVPGYHITGIAAALVTGLLSLLLLIKLIKKGQLHHFAWYCFLMAILALTVF